MEKEIIKNRKGQNIVVTADEAKNQKGLAFVMHGLGGFQKQKHIQTFAEVFIDNEYTTIRFDATNSTGESDGKYDNATVTNYYEDLEDVIKWAENENWYQEPFFLIGHSIGSMCIMLYAEKNPEKIKALAPISAIVSGELLINEVYDDEEIKDWKKTGFEVRVSKSRPGKVMKLKWDYVEDIKNYNVLKSIDKLKMPVLLIAGDSDEDGMILKHQKLLYNKLPGKKELYAIKGAGHNFREENQIKEVRDIIDEWIKSIDK